MRFRFSLEAVLRVAEIREECEEARLRAIQLEVAAAQGQQHELVRAQLEARREIAEAKQTSGGWLRAIHNSIAELSARKQAIDGHLRQLTDKVQDQQRAYVKARQTADVMRRLRQTRAAEFQREVSRREQIALDDLFLNRYR